MDKIIVITQGELVSLINTSVRQAISDQTDQNYYQEKDKIFSIQEATVFLNLAKQTLYGFTSQRQIPFIKRAKRLLFKKSDLELWLMEGRCKSISEIENNLKGGGNGY